MFLMLTAIAATVCPVEAADYVLRGNPSVEASFHAVNTGQSWPSDLALEIRFRRTGHVTWWLPWNGGTDNNQNLASTTDVTRPNWRPPSPDGGPRPLGNAEYIGTDANYNVSDAVPRRGEQAPGHFLVPHLGEAVWYHGAPAYADRPDKRFFDFVRCRR